MGYRVKSSQGRREISGEQEHQCSGNGKRHDDDHHHRHHAGGNGVNGQGSAVYRMKNVVNESVKKDESGGAIGDGGGVENGGNGQHAKRHGDCDSNQGQSQKEEFKVMQTVYKRLRNAKKRLRGIDEIREKAAAGKVLNADQVAALESRDAVVAVVEELEKLHVLLQQAVEDDVEWGMEQGRSEMEKRKAEWEKETKMAVKKAVNKAKNESKQMVKKEVKAAGQEALKSTVDAMVELLYFGGIFDPFVPFQMEKGAALQYAAALPESSSAISRVTGDSLDLVGLLGKMCTARALGTAMSHKEALDKCKEIAMQYVTGSKDVLGDTNATSEEVQSVIREVKGLEYFVAPVHVVAATAMNGVVGPASGSAAAGTSVPHAMSRGPMHVAGPIPSEHAFAQHMPVMEHEYVLRGVDGHGQADASMVYLHNTVYPTPEYAAASGQNLVTQFFGHGPHSHGCTSDNGPEKAFSVLANQGPGSFKGDEGLGIRETNGVSDGVEHVDDSIDGGECHSDAKMKDPSGKDPKQVVKNRRSETKRTRRYSTAKQQGKQRVLKNANAPNEQQKQEKKGTKAHGEKNKSFPKKRTNVTRPKQDEIKARH